MLDYFRKLFFVFLIVFASLLIVFDVYAACSQTQPNYYEVQVSVDSTIKRAWTSTGVSRNSAEPTETVTFYLGSESAPEAWVCDTEGQVKAQWRYYAAVPSTGWSSDDGINDAGACTYDYYTFPQIDTTGYTIDWDNDQDDCECYGQTWIPSLGSNVGVGYSCCGDDGASDDFATYSNSLSTSTSSDCRRCINGVTNAASTFYGNGYTTGSLTDDTTLTCYYGDIICSGSDASNGVSTSLCGNGFFSNSNTDCNSVSTAIVQSGYCYYNDISCGNGVATNGAVSELLHGNGFYSGNLALDTTLTCYTGDMVCTDGSYASGASEAICGNGYFSTSNSVCAGADKTTAESGYCYIGDMNCGDGFALSGSLSPMIYGNGYTLDNVVLDSVVECLIGDIVCADGSYANGSTSYYYGNGYVSGTTCYYGDVTCGSNSGGHGSSCTLGSNDYCGNGIACDDCAPYSRISTSACYSDCSSDNDAKCADGYHCYSQDDSCYSNANGNVCDSGSDCDSGICIEGICEGGCTSPNANDRCSSDTTFYTSGLAGRCSGTNCCSYLMDANNNGLFDDSVCACSASYSGRKCDSDNDLTWDGICAYNGASWVCNGGDAFYDGSLYYTDYTDSSMEGYACQTDVGAVGFVPDGVIVNGACFAGDPVVCPNGRGSSCTDACDSLNGYMCDANPLFSNNYFTQTGTCTFSGCQSSGEVCYSDSIYVSDCSFCSFDYDADPQGDVCDSTPGAGGNFVADGICTSDGSCDTDGEVCIDKSAGNVFKGDCSLCESGSLCDVSGISFSVDGHCYSGSCCVGNYLDVNNDGEFNDDAGACSQCSISTNFHKCSVDTDLVWDGLCVNYGSSYTCDSTLVTCRISEDSSLDLASNCEGSYIDSSSLSSSDVFDSDVDTSILIDSSVTDSSEIKSNSIINNSVVTASSIISSYVIDSSVVHSQIYNSQLCAGLTINDAVINNNQIMSGVVTRGSDDYFSPLTIDMVCSGASTNVVGSFSSDKISVSDGSALIIYYISSETGYEVSSDLSPLGGLASASLLDNGVAPDEVANDGIYTTKINNVDSGLYNGAINLEVEITSAFDVWTISGSIFVDNEDPTGSLIVYGLNGDSSQSAIPNVLLETSYSDNIVLAGCRYANDYPSLSTAEMVSCRRSLYWSLDFSNGTHTVFMRVEDLAGNHFDVNDSIYMNTSLSTDGTAPTKPIVIDDGNYTNSPNTLKFRWYNSTDPEQAILFNDIEYEYWLYNGTNFIIHNTTFSTELTLTGLNLVEGSIYTLFVSAFNIENLYSENATSDGIRTDFGVPAIPTISHGLDLVGWNYGVGNSLNLTSTDSISGVAGYSVSLGLNDIIEPDDIVDTNRTVSYSGLPDGIYYFKAKAIDNAGNIGPIQSLVFKMDLTPPTVPRLYQFEFNNSNMSEIQLNWTKSFDLSGVINYELEIARDSNFENIVFSSILGNVTDYLFDSPSGNYIYFARVRAQNSVGNWSLWSNEISGEIDVTPPEISFKKPRGIIINNSPTMIVETNEKSYCMFRTGSEPFLGFDVTNMNHHEVKLSGLSEGSHDFDVYCTDLVGNLVSDTISFSIDSSRRPDSMSITDSYNSLYSSQIALINLSILDGLTGVGEIPANEFKFLLNGKTSDLSNGGYAIGDQGNGEYILGFVVPNASATDIVVSLPKYGLSVSKSYTNGKLFLDTGCLGSSCDFIRTEQSETSLFGKEETPFSVTILYPDINMCENSKSNFDSGDCILVENVGGTEVCLIFTSDCTVNVAKGSID